MNWFKIISMSVVFTITQAIANEIIFVTKKGNPADYTPVQIHYARAKGPIETDVKPQASIPLPQLRSQSLEITPAPLVQWRERAEESPIPSQALHLRVADKRASYGKRVDYGMIDEGPDNAAPVGGLGTGTFEFDLFGQLRGFSIGGKKISDTLPEGQMSLFVQQGDQRFATPLGKRPEKDARLSAWDWNSGEAMANSATYHGLYPYSWWTYPPSKIQPANITVKQYSPFIKGDTEASSLPVFIREITIENPTDKPMDASVMFSMPNIAGWKMEGDPKREKYFRFNKTGKGQSHQVREGGKMIGVVMGSSSQEDKRLAGQVAMVAEKQKGMDISYHSAFDAQGSGAEVWDSFAKSGTLSNQKKENSGGDEQAGAVAMKVSLKPKEKRTIKLAFSWDIPLDVRNYPNKEFPKYYTRRYGSSGKNAYQIAATALSNSKKWTSEIDRWQGAILKDPRLPENLKTALINEVYYLASGGSLYTDKGFYADLENHDFGLLHTLDVAYYSPMLAHFFPSLEKGVLKAFAKQVLVEDNTPTAYMNPFPSHYGGKPEFDEAIQKAVGFDPNRLYMGPLKLKGAVPHHLDDALFGPLSGKEDNIVLGAGISQHWQNHNAWKDLNPKYGLEVWRIYQLDGGKDKAFLKEVWPAVKEAMAYQRKFDRNRDGLPDHEDFPDQTYDTWRMKGDGAYTGILTASAIEAAIKMGRIAGDRSEEKNYQAWLNQAKTSLETKLWNGRYYDIYEGNSDIMADAVAGQFMNRQYGLPDVIPDDHARKHLQTVYENNYKRFANGTVGVVNGMSKDGKTLGQIRGDEQADTAWIGTQRLIASLMLQYGLEKEAAQVLATDYANTWLDGYQYRTPEALDVNRKFVASEYMRAGSLWNVYEVLTKNSKK